MNKYAKILKSKLAPLRKLCQRVETQMNGKKNEVKNANENGIKRVK